MASLIPGFKYDIFISYRQKDNKHDGWVTDFVNQLKGELESTLKDDISVYFDTDLHDGLLETHDVDASLKEKSKCLIFIPIISRTYCDPKSYAWEHEFKTFVEQASRDQFGLKIKLSNGNVASRVLPVRIHDLSKEDIRLVETILGTIRPVDFIYHSQGVNRPLRQRDDDMVKKVDQPVYRDQINKVANAIYEIIEGLRRLQELKAEGKSINNQFTSGDGEREEVRGKAVTGKPILSQRPRRIMKIALSLIIFIAVAFAIFKIIGKSNQTRDLRKIEKSIAVLPFINDSPDAENSYFINGIMEEVLNNLQKIKEFRVLSRTSTDQYNGPNKPTLPEIAEKLKVNYIVEGSGQKYSNKFVLRVQLIAANNERHLWAKSYNREIQKATDIISVQSEIAQLIAAELKAEITPEEQIIEKTPTTNLTAYDFYQRGNGEITKFEIDPHNKAALERAEDLYHKAIRYDSTFARSYTGLARVYFKKHFFEEYFSKNFLDSVLILSDIALSYDNNLAETYTIRGEYFTDKGKTNKAIEEYDKALKINPNFWEAYSGKGNIYAEDDLVNCIYNYQKAASLNHGSELPLLLREISYAYNNAGFLDTAKYFNLEALKLDGDSISYFDNLALFEKYWGNCEKAIEFLQEEYSLDTTRVNVNFGHCYMFLNQFKESLKYYRKYIEILKVLGQFTTNDMHRIGWSFWKNGYRQEAKYYFDKQLEFSKNEIELKRPWGQKLYPYYDMAGVYAFTGEKKKSYECLNLFNRRQRMPLWVVTWMKTDPLFSSIRNEPEFQQIVMIIEEKYQAEHERVRKWIEKKGEF